MDWVEAALRFESRIDLSRIPRSVASKLECLDSVYVACSGGADSVFTLLLLKAFLSKRVKASELRVLHFDHVLRSEASAADSAFVRELCSDLRIPFLDARASWGSEESKVNEARARGARLAFFREATGAVADAPVYVVTGHHADDVVETMLMRLSRGAGLQGLCVPREISEPGEGLFFLRPVLDWSRDDIRTVLEDCAIPWREDETNVSDGNYRSRLRKETIPAWERAADRQVRPGVGRSRRMLAEDADALDFAAKRFWASCWDESKQAIRRADLEALPPAFQRRLMLMLPGGSGVASDAVEVALTAIANRTDLKLEVERGLFYEFSRDWLRLNRIDSRGDLVDWPEFQLPVGCIAYLPSGEKLSCFEVVLDETQQEKVISGSNDDQRIVYLSGAGNPDLRVVVRKRTPGDAFKPFGKSSPKKLKNLFIDRKIDRIVRDRLPVFVSEEFGILWVPGLPPNADMKLGFGSEAALRLTYER